LHRKYPDVPCRQGRRQTQGRPAYPCRGRIGHACFADGAATAWSTGRRVRQWLHENCTPDGRNHRVVREDAMRRDFAATMVTAILGLFLALSQAQQASPHAKWTRTYVVEWNEPAMYYGAKTGVTDPGTDCPNGTNPSPDWIKVLVDAGYTPEEAKWL